MPVATQPFTGTYFADPFHSSFGFAVRYSGGAQYRGTFSEGAPRMDVPPSDVRATLAATDDGLVLEGAARVESISIRQPAEFRAHVLGPDFFDAENHPEIGFRSEAIELASDGSLRLKGELTIRGTTGPVAATGTWTEPRPGMGGQRASLELHAVVDRRDFGIDWQMELPGGGVVLDNEVRLEINLALLQPDEQPA